MFNRYLTDQNRLYFTSDTMLIKKLSSLGSFLLWFIEAMVKNKNKFLFPIVPFHEKILKFRIVAAKKKARPLPFKDVFLTRVL